MKSSLRILPAFIWMAIIFYLSSVPNLELSGKLSVYDFVVRKTAHVCEYAILTGLLYWGIPTIKEFTKRKYLAGIIALLYAVSDEIHQLFVPTRGGKPGDVLIDTIGILLFIILIQYVYHAQTNHDR